MDFYHAPGSSSQATHIMLREAALDFRPFKVDIFSHSMEDGSDYRLVNPNGYVPAIVDEDGSLLTECVAILDWLTHRANALAPEKRVRTRHLQMLAFLSSEIHKPFIPLFFTEDEGAQGQLRQALEPRFGWIGGRVEGPYLFGESFTGADAMLYVMLRWAAMVDLAYPHGLDAFIDQVERRLSVRVTLAEEGFDPLRTLAYGRNHHLHRTRSASPVG
jgi:glutathione S-transferase